MWFTRLPFWERTGLIFVMACVIAVLGLFVLAAGICAGDISNVIAGSVLTVPGAFGWFLLWRTYADDGYRPRRRNERRVTKHN